MSAKTKLSAKTLPRVLGLVVTLMSGVALAAEDVLIQNFEQELHDSGWTIEGDEGFGDISNLTSGTGVTGYQREGFVYTALAAGNGARGTLTSPLFLIERDYLNFLIGGGGFEAETCMNLVVDGEIVRTAVGPNTGAGGTKALKWRSWDVGFLKGKKARIQIVDNREGEWGYIAVDYVYQSDIKMVAIENAAREFHLEKRYLNLPVVSTGRESLMRLLIDGKPVREFLITLADADPEYWVYLEVDAFQGEDAILQMSQLNSNDRRGFDAIFQADTFPGEQALYKEKLRPQFHFTSKRGWLNDPNGLVYYDGEYHLFYQHGPFGCKGAQDNQHWGHAVSTDLVHWTELGDAVHPDELGTIFSGSGVVDWNNSTGFQTGNEPPLVFAYTSAGSVNQWSKGKLFTQSIAYSNDRGRTLTKYAGNPVLPNIAPINRDPKVLWWEEGQEWVVILELDETFGFFTSKDLKKWEMQSNLLDGHFHDCPEMFELSVDDENNKKWVIHDGTGNYFCGDFDGRKFTPETELITRNYGNCFYAGQAFSNAPDGRCIEVAWGLMEFEPIPGMAFNQQITFPVDLTLRSTEDGPRLYTNPVNEIEILYGKEQSWAGVTLQPGENLLSELKGELYDIEAEFSIGDAPRFGFLIQGVPVIYDVEDGKLSSGKLEAPLKPQDGSIKLRLLVDRLSVEVFANDGRIYMPIRALNMDSSRGFEVFTDGGSTTVNSLKARELKSIWD
ncbi:GH32 C-terminal domain-containing protein [Bythopirellula goksoeyrii]|uniref:Levanase n=1 Tax=Bythopirellula goksoeyrii TaxID=1400387 RepID=A0A5B9QI82_9BACT|nr:GH32 C-terminal domain-containing protein [Bythopirellula goksoeyrii]QEG37392.1 Levanase precursor [Bythopirellula goksoeyrii]